MNIAVFLEKDHPSGLELLCKAREMAQDAVITALCETDLADSANDYARVRLTGADSAVDIGFLADDCAQGTRIAQAIDQLKPDTVLFPATVRGRFLSAWVAAKLHTGLTADCTGLEIMSDGLLKQVRPAFGGNLTAEIVCRTHRPQMASVRPGVFACMPMAEKSGFTASNMELAPVRTLLKRYAFAPVESKVSLQSAPVIIAGGKGIGGKKGFEKLFELAELLGGAVGATRSAVDAGYIPYAHQIGQTGVTVRPKLYIGFAISGLVQHAVGMNSSGTVVAVNTDRNAPIFSCADFGIIADWQQTIDALIQYVKERKT